MKKIILIKKMKFAITLIATAIFIFVKSQEDCSKNLVQCVEKNSLMEEACMIIDEKQDETTLKIANGKCKKGEICRPIEKYLYKCFNYVIPEKYTSLTCESVNDCGGIACIENKCIAKENGKECKGNSECLPNSYCSKSYTCTSLSEEGKECTENFQCGYFLFCNLYEINKGVCIKKYSLKAGNITSEEDFCESGFAIDDGEKKICANVNYSSENDTCPLEGKCAITVYNGETKYDKKVDCKCDLDGKNYCLNWPKQIELKKKVIKTALDNYKPGRVHVSYYRDELWGFSEIFSDIDNGNFIHTDECALQGLIGYKLGGSYLKIGLLVLSFLLI